MKPPGSRSAYNAAITAHGAMSISGRAESTVAPLRDRDRQSILVLTGAKANAAEESLLRADRGPGAMLIDSMSPSDISCTPFALPPAGPPSTIRSPLKPSTLFASKRAKAIIVDTRKYEASHQRSPRGRGGWLFELRRLGEPAQGVDYFGEVGTLGLTGVGATTHGVALKAVNLSAFARFRRALNDARRSPDVVVSRPFAGRACSPLTAKTMLYFIKWRVGDDKPL